MMRNIATTMKRLHKDSWLDEAILLSLIPEHRAEIKMRQSLVTV
jgi:hypothetical protein